MHAEADIAVTGDPSQGRKLRLDEPAQIGIAKNGGVSIGFGLPLFDERGGDSDAGAPPRIAR